jgi:serine/threonine protein kinase
VSEYLKDYHSLKSIVNRNKTIFDEKITALLVNQLLSLLSHLHSLNEPIIHGRVDVHHVLCNSLAPNFLTSNFQLVSIETNDQKINSKTE